jgi:mRNA-degrading endonuclease RelE of RelBE toxin-antitoxin system
MQVSIYLDEEVVKKVDRLAKKERRSRSKVIEALLESSLRKIGAGSRFESLMGSWKDDRSAKEIIEEISKDRERNRRSERVAL